MMMDKILQGLQIDIPVVCREIEDLICTTMENLQRDGAVVGVSGGLDSAVAAMLTVRCLGADKVQLLNMPDRDSKPIHRKHAKQLAEHLGLQLTVKSITPILRTLGTYKLLPLRFVPSRRLREKLVKYGITNLLSKKSAQFLRNRTGKERGESLLVHRLLPEANSWVAKGSAYALAKHRIRMTALYQYAEVGNLMVVGAANRTEWLTGTFSKWGIDHCADVMPLMHVYRSQLEQIAETIQVPGFIRNKAADPDIMPGIDDKGELLGSFDLVDQILCGIEMEMSEAELGQVYGEEVVKRLFTLWELSRHMRESPYHVVRMVGGDKTANGTNV